MIRRSYTMSTNTIEDGNIDGGNRKARDEDKFGR